MINKCDSPEDGSYVRWECDGHVIEKTSKGRIFGVPLKSGNGVVVVDLHSSAGSENAKIFNCDGTERCTVSNPMQQEGAICYEDIYYVGDELTLILAMPERQFACVVDENGHILKVYETR